MSYASLGNQCVPHTPALTSNRKYLLPDNEVYWWEYTSMYKYPSQDSTYTDAKAPDDPRHPDLIKSYYGKQTVPYPVPKGKPSGGCSSCG